MSDPTAGRFGEEAATRHGPPDAAIAGGIVHLEALRRLTLGAAHTLNNALTSILGEVRLLADEHAGDGDLARACAEIERQVERCARLTHALQARGAPRAGGEGDEIDLAALLRAIAPLLRDTVSRSVELAWSIPDGGAWVRGRRDELERLIVVAVHRMLRSGDGGRLRLDLVAAPGDAALELRLAREGTSGAGSAGADPWDETVEAAARAIAARAEVGWHPSDDDTSMGLRFAAAPEDPDPA